MFKRLLVIASALLVIFSVSVVAVNEYNITVGEDFNTLENSRELAEIFEVSESELSKFCADNNVSFLAANNDRSKEIRLQTYQTDFSQKVGDFSNYSYNEIYTISLDIIGSSNVTGRIVENNGRRFIKTETSSGTGSDDYTVLQYTTITGGEYYILSFYSNNGVDNSFAENIFNSFEIKIESESGFVPFEIIIPICIVILAVIILIVLFYIIKTVLKIKDGKTKN